MNGYSVVPAVSHTLNSSSRTNAFSTLSESVAQRRDSLLIANLQ